MFRRRFSPRDTRVVLCVLSVAVIVSVSLKPTRLRAQAPATASSTQRSGLRQQRIETLQQAADISRRMFEQGLTTTGEVFRVNRLLLDAQLEAATSAKDRTKLLQEALQVAKRQEELATTQLQAGAAGPLVPLEAKAERLRVEIQLSEMTTK